MVSSSTVGGAFILSLKAIGTIVFLWSVGILFGLLPRSHPFVQENSNRAFAKVVVNLAVPMTAFVNLCKLTPSSFLWELPLAGTIFLVLSYAMAYTIIRLGDLFNAFAVCSPSAVAMIIVVSSWEATAFALALILPVCTDRCSYVSGQTAAAEVASTESDCVSGCKSTLTAMIILFFTPWRIAYPLTKLLYVNELKRRSVVKAPARWIQRTRRVCRIGRSVPPSLSVQRRGRFTMQVFSCRKQAKKTAGEKQLEPPLQLGRRSKGIVPTTKSIGSDIGRRAPYPATQRELQERRESELSPKTSLFRLVTNITAGEEFEREVDLLWSSTHNLNLPKQSLGGRDCSTIQSRLVSVVGSSDGAEHHGVQASQDGNQSEPLAFLDLQNDDLKSRTKSRLNACPFDVPPSEQNPSDIMSDSVSNGRSDAMSDKLGTGIQFQPEPSAMASIPFSPQNSIAAAENLHSSTEDETPEESPESPIVQLPTVVLCPTTDRPSRRFPVDAPADSGFDMLSPSRLESDITPRIPRVEDDPTMEPQIYDKNRSGFPERSLLSWSSLAVNEGGALYAGQKPHEYVWRSSTQDLTNIPDKAELSRPAGPIENIEDIMKRCWSSVPYSTQICVGWSFIQMFLSNTIIATIIGMCLLSWNGFTNVFFSPPGAMSWLGEVLQTWANLVVPLQGIITGSHLTRIFRSHFGDVTPEESVKRMPWVVILSVSLARMVVLPILGIVILSYAIPLYVAKETLCEMSNGDFAAFGLAVTMALVCPPGEAVLVFSGFNPGDLHLFVLPCCLVAIFFMMTWSVISLVDAGYYDPVTACP
eukprot:GHVS01073536.1.p1 GENE.GHVS01073536.1~~GHVS01073536.1.p1  ORF type:complete len:813 (-),score=41.84 GHVS01073536.1:115-2553(-)